MSVSEVEIGVWVEGVQKWVTGVTRRTTCHDLIKALLRAQQRCDDADVIQYVIVERWRKVERPLDHEQRILKVWRTWGEAVSEVRFSLRRVRDGEGVGVGGVGGSSGRAERSRRRQKMKHHAHGTREALHPRKLPKEEAKFSDTMERLMRLVVAQGETIQTQLRRLQERESQIEQYEQQMHLLRVQNLGTDYLLHSYLKDDGGEAKDEPGSEEKSNDSGVVTEDLPDPPPPAACHGLDADDKDAAAAAGLRGGGSEDVEEFAVILAKIEEVNARLLHEEEALSGMAGAVTAAREQHRDEEELLRQELACVAHVHAQLVADARHNEHTLRETEVVLWQQRKQLEALLIEDTESDLETKALREHLDYIIHLPPTAFRLPEDDADDPALVVTSARPVHDPAGGRVPSLAAYDGDLHATLRHNGTAKACTPTHDSLPPPPLPTCPPPVVEEDDDRDSANTSSLCVSSRSSTSSEASTGMTNGVSTKPAAHTQTRKTPATASSSTSCSTAAAAARPGEAAGKDTDSTDSNSDTGLSSLHSSSDEAAYALDTLV